jgi:ribonucleoside-diphosphate reductase alpha chain
MKVKKILSKSQQSETAFCTLAAINVGKVDFDEYEHIAEVALRAVDKMIDAAPMMTKAMKNDIMRRRSAGIGIMGLAVALYKNDLDYDGSVESLGFVSKLAEHHYFYLLKASQKLAEECGYGVDGVDLNWLPVDTRVGQYSTTLDWESVRGKARKNSVLAAHMPTESSALFSDGPNSLYPPRQRVINKKSRKGLVQYICKELDSSKKLAWDVDNITLAKYYSAVQDFTDQAISADYYFDPSKYADEKKPLSELMKEWVAQAKMGNKTQYYMNTRDYNGGSVQDVMKASVPEEEACESCKL